MFTIDINYFHNALVSESRKALENLEVTPNTLITTFFIFSFLLEIFLVNWTYDADIKICWYIASQLLEALLGVK